MVMMVMVVWGPDRTAQVLTEGVIDAALLRTQTGVVDETATAPGLTGLVETYRTIK